MRVDFVPFGFRKGEGVPEETDELPPRAAHTVEAFEGACIGFVEGRCRNCWNGYDDAPDPIPNGAEVALYVKEREPVRSDDDPRPSGYEILSLWHADCEPKIGTRTLDEYLLGGTLRRETYEDGDEVREYLDDVELLAYSPAECGVDLLAHDDDPMHDTRETPETEAEEGEVTRSNPTLSATESDEDGGLARGGEETLDKIEAAAELVAEVDDEIEAETGAARRALADLEEVVGAELRESRVEM
jgi:hypothetical protein